MHFKVLFSKKIFILFFFQSFIDINMKNTHAFNELYLDKFLITRMLLKIKHFNILKKMNLN